MILKIHVDFIVFEPIIRLATTTPRKYTYFVDLREKILKRSSLESYYLLPLDLAY